MRILLSKHIVIEAAHVLKSHPGKCSREHGHSWKIELTVSSNVDPDTNMGIDYYLIGKFLSEEVDAKYDHQNLNTVLSEDNPTSEFLTYNLFAKAVKHFEASWARAEGIFDADPRVEKVRVWETAKCSCIVTREMYENGRLCKE